MTTSESDFDAAKAVADQLKGLDKERQQRVLRWVAESLNLDLGAVSATPLRSNELRQQDPAGGHHQPLEPTRQHRPTDIKSFVDAKQPKSDVQFAAAVAYYYRFEAPAETRKDAIDAQTLQEGARLAGRRRPPKPLMTLNNAKNLGYLDSPERGQFRINTVGENLVAMTLPGSGGDKPRGGSRSTRKRSSKKKPKR
jgi:hypothetical protein